MKKLQQSSEVHSSLDLIAPSGDGWAWTFRGWACDVKDPDKPIRIEIREAGHVIATTVPTMLRPDVAERYKSHGTHGFCFALRGGGKYRDIEITANGNPIGVHIWDAWNWVYRTPFRPGFQLESDCPILNHLYVSANFHAGMITPYEMKFVMDQIAAEKVSCALEIGTASGMSTAGIAMALSASSEGEKIPFHTVDSDSQFYDDRSLEIGLTAIKYQNEEEMQNTDLKIHTSRSRCDLPEILDGEKVNFAFIDADHKHPGTTLDFICTLPLTQPGCRVLFHDLKLAERKEETECGPSHLWQCLPAPQKLLGVGKTDGNIGAFTHQGTPRELSKFLAEALLKTWTGDGGHSEEEEAGIRKVMEEHYDPCLVEAWDKAAKDAGQA